MENRALIAYKRMLSLAKRLPVEERASAIANIREAFHKGKGETNPDAIADMLKQANSKISYLKMVTPKDHTSSQGATREILVDGKLHSISNLTDVNLKEGEKRISQTELTGYIDPELYKRHNQLLRRMQFLDRGMPPPRSPFSS